MTHDALETSIAESMGRFVSFPFEFFFSCDFSFIFVIH